MAVEQASFYGQGGDRTKESFKVPNGTLNDIADANGLGREDAMKPKPVNPLRWAATGAFLGLALALTAGSGFTIGHFLGSGAGGAFLFGLAAWVRNLFVR